MVEKQRDRAKALLYASRAAGRRVWALARYREAASGTHTAPLAVRRTGWNLIAILLIVVGIGTAQTVPKLSAARGTETILATLAFMLLIVLSTQRPLPAVFLAAGALAAAMQVLNPAGPAIAAAIAVVAITTRLPAQVSSLVAAVIGIAYLAAFAATRHTLFFETLTGPFSSLFFTYLGSASFAGLRREQRHTAALLQEVLDGRDARIRAAALDERARLAREMHDVLAHTLAALSIQLEGTRLLAEQQGADPALIGRLERVSGLAREGLAEARRAVGSLRDESLPGPDRLEELAAIFSQDAGIPCTLHLEGTPRELGPEARLTIYRVAQEALTNIRKHAAAREVEMLLRYEARAVTLTITNQGGPSQTPLKGGGYGLLGMRERAELLGGRLDAGPVLNGFRVSLWIPQ